MLLSLWRPCGQGANGGVSFPIEFIQMMVLMLGDDYDWRIMIAMVVLTMMLMEQGRSGQTGKQR